MWKIKIIYKDKSTCTLTGNHKEIPLELAVNYFNKYVADHVIRSARYQQYPKKDYSEMDLLEKSGRRRILTMKENEASVLIGNIPVNGKDGCYSITEYQEAKTVAVQALEEIQQYRAIGTPEECRAAVEKQNRLQKTEHWKISTGTIVNVMWITQLYIAAIRRNQRMSRVLPILFNTEMVRAILDGRKSCTRRIVKPQPQSRLCYTFAGSDCGTWGYPSKTAHESWGDKYRLPDGITDEELKRRWKPPYRVDDILYVRETWQYLYELDGNEQIIEGTGKYYYAATDTIPFDTYVDASGVTHERVPWHPSIHMPKEAARIWLKVTDVRVERL